MYDLTLIMEVGAPRCGGQGGGRSVLLILKDIYCPRYEYSITDNQ